MSLGTQRQQKHRLTSLRSEASASIPLVKLQQRLPERIVGRKHGSFDH